MYFSITRAIKITAAILIFSSILTSLTGCKFHFRESAMNDAPMQLKAADSGCLSGSSEILSRYLQGNASSEEVSGVWRCLNKSLQLFSERTDGETPGLYSSAELRNFMQKYFLKNFKISDSLLREIMELKCAILGGTTEAFTLDELQRTRHLIRILDEESTKLRPFMPLTPTWAVTHDEAKLDAAVSALDSAAQALARPLQKSGHPYLFSHLETLRKEVEGISHNPGIIEKLGSRLPLLRAVKSIFVAPNEDRVDGHEWVHFVTTTARWYGIALRMAHLQANYKSWVSGAGRERLASVAVDAITLLDEAVARHPGELITFAEIDELIDALAPAELPLPAQDAEQAQKARKILKDLKKPLIRRILGGASTGRDGRAAQGLTRPALRRALDIVEHWSEGQHFLEALFAKLDTLVGHNGSGALGYVAEDLLKLKLEDVLPAHEISPVTVDAATRIRTFIPLAPPLFMADDPEITLAGQVSNRRYSFNNLSMMNALHEFSRTMIRGYSEDMERAKHEGGLNLAEMSQALEDVKEFAFARKILDPNRDNRKMIATRFQEGMLFTFASQGQDVLNHEEIAQLSAFLLSAYHLSGRIHSEIAQVCENGPPDALTRPTLPAECYRAHFFASFEHFLSRLPRMADYYNSLSDEDRASFRASLEKAARLPGSNKDVMASNDTVGFAGLIQYIEALFTRFDKDQSGGLNFKEAQKAFPVFKLSLQKIIKKKGLDGSVDEEDYEALFMYILANGAPPSADLGGWISWWWWRTSDSWEFEADRLKIIQIFGALLQEAR